MDARKTITEGKAILGIEFGSTRIKAVLIDEENKPIAQGSHEWENQLVDGLWTYSIEAIWYGLQDCYADLRKDVMKQYDCEIESLAAIGFSAMMHGYMAFNKNQEILVPFRTWRNTNTGKAAAELSRRRALPALQLQHPAALEHFPSLSVHSRGQRACERHQVPHHPGRLCTLAGNRTIRVRCWRCFGYDSRRSQDQDV